MTRTVLVTGVSSGIGLAQAALFLAQGDRVFGVDIGEKPNLSGDFHFYQADVSKDLENIISFCPCVDVLCPTAGVLDDFSPLLEMTDERFEHIFAINFTAVRQLISYYLPMMIAKKEGVIITMCSIASSLAGGGGAAYTASKHALAGLTKQLALDYARTGVQIFGIAPGAVQTGMTKADFEEGGLADWVAEETPIGRWSQPEEIAELTLFLASGKASYMHGQIVTIDGGWSLK